MIYYLVDVRSGVCIVRVWGSGFIKLVSMY